MPHQLHTTMPQKKHLMFPVYKYVNEFCLVRFELVAKKLHNYTRELCENKLTKYYELSTLKCMW
jgi:hypothetical protein